MATIQSRNDTRERRALLRAAEHGDAASLKPLLRGAKQANLDEALVLACSRHHTIAFTDGHVRVVKMLLNAGANPDARGGWGYDRPLTAAAAGGFGEVVAILLDAGATKDLFAMAALGDAAGVKRLLTRSPDLATQTDDAGMLALHHCANSCMGRDDPKLADRLAKIATLLLDHGAPVNGTGAPSKVQRLRPMLPPLVYAAMADNLAVAKVLLGRGGDPNPPSPWGTPLMQACKYSPAIATLLLEHGARIDAPVSTDGRTALHIMAHFPHPAAVEWLLAHGADPTARMDDGRTPLHWAAARNTGPRVAQMLVEAGADVNARDKSGLTPLAYAQRKKKLKVAAFLKQHGGVSR